MATITDILGMTSVDDITIKDLNIFIIEKKENYRKILMDNIVYDVIIKNYDYENKNATINIDGFDFHLQLNEPIDLLIAQMGFLKSNKHSVKDIKSPMPGLVISIYVEVGQNVHEGDKLLSLEAMKMENILKCPGSGIVKNILVKSGDTVDKNALLIELE